MLITLSSRIHLCYLINDHQNFDLINIENQRICLTYTLKRYANKYNHMSYNVNSQSSSSPSKDEIIHGLNEDLAREYKAIVQYVVFSSTLKGAEYGDIAEQLKIHASQELSHALEIARQIDYLGGEPTVKGKEAESSQDSKTMLEIDLRAEQETITGYKERIRQAEMAGEFALSQKLREIIAQEQDHEIDLKDALGLD